MDETDCEEEWPLTSLEARFAFGGGRGAARCGTSSEMATPEVGI
jgi:hypothetical protein